MFGASQLEALNSTQKKLTLFVVGVLANLAFAPFDFFPILLLSFPLFLLVLQTATTRKQAFWFGWWFGFGHFLAGLYWISNSLLVDAEQFAWLVPFAMAGIPSVLAIYIGLLGLAFFKITQKRQFSQVAKIFIFINLWLLTEFARNWLFTGFPWNLLGYSLLFSLPLAQLASVGGVFICSWFALLLAFLPLMRTNKKAFALVLVALIAAYAFGAYRIENAQTVALNKTVKIIQPNIEQTMKWDPALASKNFNGVLELTEQGGSADLIVWPEAASTYHLNRSAAAVEAIQNVLPQNAQAIVGSARSEGDSYEDYKIWNSIYVLSKNKIEGRYDKQHLVPFGEYVPFSEVLPLDKITPGRVDFSRGEGGRQLSAAGLNLLPLLCYEVIFTNYGFSAQRPDAIVTITNDAWFGNSTGPYQHLAMARMRAIEQGVPVLRAANTGVSAIVDSFGGIKSKVELNQSGFIISAIPDRLLDKTLYNSSGFLGIFLIILSSSIIIFFYKKN